MKTDTLALRVVSGQIKDDTTQLRRDTEQILSDMSMLKLGLASQRLEDHAHQGRINIMERYLDSLTDYCTESVMDSIDRNGESVAESDDENGDGPFGPVLTPRPRQTPSTTTVGETGVELDMSRVPQFTDVEEPSSRPPRPSEWTFPRHSVSVLVLGPPGHGKSSFIRRLMHLPGQPTGGLVQPPTGPRVLGQVAVCEAEVSTSEYHFVHKATGEPVSSAEAESNARRAGFEFNLANPYASRVKLRLVEANFDYSLDGVELVESMGSLLATLGGLGGTLDAVAIVHKLEARPGISADCQRILRYFEAAIPDLFDAPSVVNTHIDPSLGKTTRSWALEARMEEFGSLFSTMKDAAHFLIDSPPSDGPLDTEILACRESARLLSSWFSRKPSLPQPIPSMPLASKMQLVKTPHMREIDSVMVQALRKAALGWAAHMGRLQQRRAKQEKDIANAEVKLKDSIKELDESEAALAKYDNENKIELNTHTEKPGVLERIKISSSPDWKYGFMTVTEPYDKFLVDWGTLDSNVGSWFSQATFDGATRTWKRQYKIRKGRQIQVTTYVLQSYKYREAIGRWKSQKSQLESDIPAQRKRLEEMKEALKLSREEDRLPENREVLSWADELAQEQLPIDKRFDQAERTRYAMLPDGLSAKALFAFVESKGGKKLIESPPGLLGIRDRDTSLQSVIDGIS